MEQNIGNSASKTNFPVTVSVWIITYNHESYIAQTIESVLMQKTAFPFEIVIGDDYSTDNTRRICLEYKEKYPEKIRLRFSETNKGIMDNYTATLMMCEGKYVAFCEGDDYWTDPDKLQKQVDLLEANPHYVGCMHNGEVLYEESKETITYFREAPPAYFTFEDALTGLIGLTASLMIRNHILTDADIILMNDNKVVATDRLITALLAEKGNIGFINERMCVYRKHSQAVTGNKNGDFFIDAEQYVLLKLRGYYDGEHTDKIKKARMLSEIKRVHYRALNRRWSFIIPLLASLRFVRGSQELKLFLKDGLIGGTKLFFKK